MKETVRRLLYTMLLFNLGFSSVTALEVENPAGQNPKPAAEGEPSRPAGSPASAKVRVLVTEGDAWSQDNSAPSRDEVVAKLRKKCPEFAITADYRRQSDYVIRLDRKGEPLRLAVLSGMGSSLYTTPQRPPADPLKAACNAIHQAIRDANKKPPEVRPPAVGDQWPGAGGNKGTRQ